MSHGSRQKFYASLREGDDPPWLDKTVKLDIRILSARIRTCRLNAQKKFSRTSS
jgi:hypothetical protein